jgi:hypothetical protein
MDAAAPSIAVRVRTARRAAAAAFRISAAAAVRADPHSTTSRRELVVDIRRRARAVFHRVEEKLGGIAS